MDNSATDKLHSAIERIERLEEDRKEIDVVTISRAELKAYRAAAEILLEAYPNASEDVDDKCNCTQCRSERTVNALRAAGMLWESN